MSTILRILLLIAALFTAFCILRTIRRHKVKMEHAIFWMMFAVILVLIAVFPEATYWLTNKVGVMSPANLVFLVIIFLLIEKIFTLSLVVSQLEDKIEVLSAETALISHEEKHKKDNA